MKKITLLLTILTLAFSSVSGQTVFDLDTNASKTGLNTITETIDGITLTFSGSDGGGEEEVSLVNAGGFAGTSGNYARISYPLGASALFTFSEPVNVNSILPADGFSGSMDFTFTPTGGTNSPVVASIVSGASATGTVALNWVGVTSFKVTASEPALIGFDNLSVSPDTTPPTTVFDLDTNAVDNGDNVTETIDGITLTFSGGDNNIGLINAGGWLGTSGNIAWHTTTTTSPVTFSFSEPVNVNSILPVDGYSGSMDYTFTPTGGSNTPVVVAIVGGGATTGTVDLNWVGVTSFTITASAPAGIGFDNLSVSPDTTPPTTVFDLDTNAVDNGDNVTETIDGITLTFSGAPNIELLDAGGWMGTSGNIAWNNTQITGPVTFTFSVPVNVNSILPVDGYSGSMDYTFTPTGGSNSPVVVPIVDGAPATGTVDLNWVGVTSFTITASAAAGIGFDNLSVSSGTLSVNDDYVSQKVLVYPNPVVDILYIKHVLNLKSINIYNHLGQLVLQSKQETIDVGHLSKGMYFLQINTSDGTETKRIIKK